MHSATIDRIWASAHQTGRGSVASFPPLRSAIRQKQKDKACVPDEQRSVVESEPVGDKTAYAIERTIEFRFERRGQAGIQAGPIWLCLSAVARPAVCALLLLPPTLRRSRWESVYSGTCCSCFRFVFASPPHSAVVRCRVQPTYRPSRSGCYSRHS